MTMGILRTGGFVLNVATNFILKNQKLNIVRTAAQRWRVITMTAEEVRNQLEELIKDRSEREKQDQRVSEVLDSIIAEIKSDFITHRMPLPNRRKEKIKWTKNYVM
jgi:hypothetical protein